MRRLLLLTGTIVLVDTLFFAALTPLLPHYAHTLGLGKAGAGVLSAAYPAGSLLGSIPSGIVAARAGVKPTVLVGMTIVAITIALFGLGTEAWELDAARFCQGIASAFSWTGALAWLVAASPPGRRGSLIGQAFAFAIGGALLGPVLGGIASIAGTRSTFIAVAVASLGVTAWAAATPAARPEEPQGVGTLLRVLGDRQIALGAWLVVLPALCFGTLAVLAPLKLSALGFSAVGIGAIWLVAAALETVNNLGLGRLADRFGPLAPIRGALLATIVIAAALPWPDRRFQLAVLVVCAGVAFGSFYTPGMTLLTHAADARGLDYGYAFALVNLAWAPGQAGGAAIGGALAARTSDAVPYLGLATVALLTFLALWRFGSSS